MNPSDPNTWVPPNWHPDFGNPTVELESLRAVSSAILANIPQTEVCLECVEEGYMSVEIMRCGVAIGEVNVIDSDSVRQRYGVFIETYAAEDEAYFADIESVVAHIRRCVSQGLLRMPESAGLIRRRNTIPGATNCLCGIARFR